MRNSRRIKRMSRNRVKIPKMNLTSLMDVFTILVFFLLVNTGSVELVEAPKDVKLPARFKKIMVTGGKLPPQPRWILRGIQVKSVPKNISKQ